MCFISRHFRCGSSRYGYSSSVIAAARAPQRFRGRTAPRHNEPRHDKQRHGAERRGQRRHAERHGQRRHGASAPQSPLTPCCCEYSRRPRRRLIPSTCAGEGPTAPSHCDPKVSPATPTPYGPASGTPRAEAFAYGSPPTSRLAGARRRFIITPATRAPSLTPASGATGAAISPASGATARCATPTLSAGPATGAEVGPGGGTPPAGPTSIRGTVILVRCRQASRAGGVNALTGPWSGGPKRPTVKTPASSTFTASGGAARIKGVSRVSGSSRRTGPRRGPSFITTAIFAFPTAGRRRVIRSTRLGPCSAARRAPAG